MSGLLDQLKAAQREGTAHELVVAAGQSVGRVDEVESAGTVVHQIVAEATEVLARLATLTTP